MYSFISPDLKRLIFYLFLIVTYVLPLLMLPILKMRGIIKNFYLSNACERILPLLITGVIYFVGYYFIAKLQGIPRFIAQIMLASVVSVFAALLITTKWKISIHMLGLGGLTGIALVFAHMVPGCPLVYLNAALLLSGLVGSARLLLGEHVPLQVYAGYALGVCIALVSFYIDI